MCGKVYNAGIKRKVAIKDAITFNVTSYWYIYMWKFVFKGVCQI